MADLGTSFKRASSTLEAKLESTYQNLQVSGHRQEKIEDALLDMNHKYEKLVTIMAQMTVDFETEHENKSVEGSVINANPRIVISTLEVINFEGSTDTRGEYMGNTRLPKADFPHFGGEGPKEWLGKAMKYFQLHQTPDKLRLGIAKMHLDGRAYVWFYVFIANHPRADWGIFSEELCKRFVVNTWEEMCIEEESQNNDGAGVLLDAKIEIETDVEHRELHNAYGYYIHMATTDGLVKRGNGKDMPLVLSRAFFAGSQTYGAIWTGDNSAGWDYLRVSFSMVLTPGLIGISFSGADVGEFFGNSDTELLVRWYQVGAYDPFFRAHAHHDTKRREPWLFEQCTTQLMREAIHNCFMFLPYLYTLFREAKMTGVPVVCPLWMEFPDDERTFSNDEAYASLHYLLNSKLVKRMRQPLTTYKDNITTLNLEDKVNLRGRDVMDWDLF